MEVAPFGKPSLLPGFPTKWSCTNLVGFCPGEHSMRRESYWTLCLQLGHRHEADGKMIEKSSGRSSKVRGQNKKNIVLECKSLRIVRGDNMWNFRGCIINGMWGMKAQRSELSKTRTWGKSLNHLEDYLLESYLSNISLRRLLGYSMKLETWGW